MLTPGIPRFRLLLGLTVVVLTLLLGIRYSASGAFASKLGANGTISNASRLSASAPVGHSALAVPAANMVVNGDFETGSTIPFTTSVQGGSASITSDPNFVHSGTFAAQVSTGATTSVSEVAGGGSCTDGKSHPCLPEHCLYLVRLAACAFRSGHYQHEGNRSLVYHLQRWVVHKQRQQQ